MYMCEGEKKKEPSFNYILKRKRFRILLYYGVGDVSKGMDTYENVEQRDICRYIMSLEISKSDSGNHGFLGKQKSRKKIPLKKLPKEIRKYRFIENINNLENNYSRASAIEKKRNYVYHRYTRSISRI